MGISWCTERHERWFAGVWLRALGRTIVLRRASWWDPPAWWLLRRQPVR